MPGPMVPTFWINLGPLGVMPISLIALADATPFIADKVPFHVAALLLWGFGAWWLLHGGAAHLFLLEARPVALRPVLVAFTFPNGAFALRRSSYPVWCRVPALSLSALIAFGLSRCSGA